MSALDGLEDTFRKWGIRVVPGDIVDGRPGAFTPTHVMVHHTGSGLPKDGPAPNANVVREGRPGLHGPLCNVLLRRDDSVEIISRGKANHAGAGRWPGIPEDEGNRYALGIEIEHNGTPAEPWTRERMVFIRRVIAACLDHLSEPATHLVAHKEYAPKRKIDPYAWVMDAERREVARVLAAGPPTDLLEEIMADPKERAALIEDIATAVWAKMVREPFALGPSTSAELGTPRASFGQLAGWGAASAHDTREATARVEADLADGVKVEPDAPAGP